MAAALLEIQTQVGTLHEHNRNLSQELGSANQQITALNQEVGNANQRAGIFEAKLKEMEAIILNWMSKSGGGGSEPREEKVSLVNIKTMTPKVFDGKQEGHFRTWAKKVRSYCNATRPGFKQFLKWIEKQDAPIEPLAMHEVNWKYKDAANDAMYDFLMIHTSDEAQTLVELAEDNGCEAWRQLCRRFDPVGESYVIDQMSMLMEVDRCTKFTDLPASIARWERGNGNYMKRTGGPGVPEEWKIPILFKMIPKSSLDDIKMRHKYATKEEKSYDRFSRTIVELATEKIYDNARARGKDDMDVDPVDPDDDEREYTNEEWVEWELNYLGKGKGKGQGQKGKGKGKGCHWCGKAGHQKKDCKEFED